MAAKLLPYGITDFENMMTNNFYYVDKTHFIQKIETAPSFFFFVRPRRFGKSLMINMLSHYYDKKSADKFETLFGNLAIGKNPTKFKNYYLILSLNFSGVMGSTLQEIEQRFMRSCRAQFKLFIEYYANFFSKEEIESIKEEENIADQLVLICGYLKINKQKVYLIIDEYDHFTNNILTKLGTLSYQEVTHGTGFFRAFLNKVKECTSSTIERIFITGVSPITMDDLTSGFNIMANMSNEADFNDMMGFSEVEVRQMLTYFYNEGTIREHTPNELIEIMKPWYDNYCFNEDCLDEPPLYNSDMVLYFLNSYQRNKKLPKEMIDRNIRTDYNKLRHLISVDKNSGYNTSVIQEIITTGGTSGKINTGFSVHELVHSDNFKSLLYYLGLVTISGTYRGMLRLTVPNQVIKEQMYQFLAEAYKEGYNIAFDTKKLDTLMENLAFDGEWEPYFEFVSEQLRAHSAIREFMNGEAHVKGFLLAYMGMNNNYIVFPEYEMNKGFSDFYMQPKLYHQPDILYSYVVEIKYAKRDAPDTVLDQLQEEAAVQLAQYAQCEKVQSTIGHTELRKLAVIYRGWEMVRWVRV